MEMKDALREKLEIFIRKYYLNRLIKGLIYGVGLGLGYFFILTVAEYFGRFGSQTRFVLLISLLAGLIGILGYYILYPVAKLFNLGRRIGYDRAARLIGRHFPDVDDKILNTLQLQNISSAQSDLLRASIDQRIESLSPIPFTNAIDFRENRKYWPILVVPVIVFAGIFLSGRWDVVSESGKRLAAYNVEFLPEAPFDFVLRNDDLAREQGEDITFELSFHGKSIPADAEILLPSGNGRMARGKDGNFLFTVNNLQSSFDFRFSAAGFLSPVFHLEVLPVPQVNSFLLGVSPPAYTGLKPFETEARLVQDVPEGSKVTWKLNLRQADEAFLVIDSIAEKFIESGGEDFVLERTVKDDFDYTVKTKNQMISKNSISGNRLKVIRDEFPKIQVDFSLDSSMANVIYYSGRISDDYGFSGLKLIIKRGDKVISKALGMPGSGVTRAIGGVITLDSLSGGDSESLKLYLEVGDNDGVNGAKKARSDEFGLNLLGKKAKKEEISKEYDKFFSRSKENQEQLEEIQKALERLRKELMDKKSLSFKEKTKLKDLLEKQQKLLEKQRQNEELLDKLHKKEDKLSKKSEEIKKKEEEIDKIDAQKKDELDQLLKDIEKLMEKLDVQKLAEKLQDIKKNNENSQKAQDRKDDLIKDLKFQKDLLEQMEKLEDLAKEMEELSKKSDNKDGSEESKKQEEVKKELEEVKDKVAKMKEENKAFDKASKEQKAEEKGEEASEELDKAQESLDKAQQQKANDSQKKAGEKMQEMSESLQSSMMQMQAKANELNMATLRKILENLEVLSFDVESLSDRSKRVEKDDPLFKDLLIEQMRLKEGAQVIEDSLTVLAKKVPEIEQDVFTELDLIKANLDKSIEDLQELRSGQAAGHQQYVMTSANNLALMLDQSLRQMQMMAAQSKPGNQQCQKPGSKPGSKPGKAQIRKMQQGLGEKMDRMSKGKKGDKGEGESGKKGERGMSGEDIVKTISEQEQLRQALEELSKNEGNQGSKGNLQKAIEEMKELEREMLEGELSPGYRERLREIESRLLESEKAEREQKTDEKRESESAKELDQLYLQELNKYLKSKEEENETLDRLPVEFLNYYKSETTKYISK